MWATLAAVNDGSAGAGQVLTWTSGTAPLRRFVVSWDRVAVGSAEAGIRLTIQVQLHEGTGAIVFAYAAQTVTGRTTPPANFVCGLDSPADARFTAPLAPTANNAGTPPSDFVFVPRTVHFNSPDAPEVGVPVTWQQIPRESLRGADGADSCCYVAAGTAWFSAPDRVTRSKPARAKELAAEDRVDVHPDGVRRPRLDAPACRRDGVPLCPGRGRRGQEESDGERGAAERGHARQSTFVRRAHIAGDGPASPRRRGRDVTGPPVRAIGTGTARGTSPR